ncbi:MAG: DUF4369 domain-containing protein [Prevotella sp.]|nr:DUF4369 domain-containing protein [Prevotella sp.]
MKMYRHAILSILTTILLLTSCAGSYNVQGSSSMSGLDGRMLYLKAVEDNELTSLDSCDVLHGEFHFSGTLDTIRMVNLFMGEEWVMPVVLESGPITISLTSAQQRVSGTPLNETLYRFLDKKLQIQNQIEELSHKEAQAIMDGERIEDVHDALIMQAQRLSAELDELETTFIVKNSDNILGPSIFETLCSGFQYPVLTPQIEEIMSRATQKFKSHPFVMDYYRTATENMRLMQGYDRKDLDNLPSE